MGESSSPGISLGSPPFYGIPGCLDFAKANMYADDTHTTIASNDIKELIGMTKKKTYRRSPPIEAM